MLDDIFTFLVCISVTSVLGYFSFVRKEYKKQKQEIEYYKEKVKQLEAELKEARKKTEAAMWAAGFKVARKKYEETHNKIPSFLLEDEPMDALLSEVGKVKKHNQRGGDAFHSVESNSKKNTKDVM